MQHVAAIASGMLLMAAMHAFDAALAEPKQTGRSPAPPGGMMIAQAFGRFGTAEWDAVRAAALTDPAAREGRLTLIARKRLRTARRTLARCEALAMVGNAAEHWICYLTTLFA